MAAGPARVMFHKARPVRSPAYRRWVASLPCGLCGVEGFSQAAHQNQGKGLSMKVCDLLTFPACAPHWGMPGCHWQIDTSFQMTREQRREIELTQVAATQDKARAAGRPEIR